MKKIKYFDYMRAFGALAVVLLHVFAITLDNSPVATIGIPTALAYSEMQIVFTRWAVPVFFMMSGALLLNPAKSVSWAKIKKYATRMLIVLATFGLLYCLMESVFSHGFTVEAVCLAVINLLEGESWSHMWYVYALLGLYLLTPILRAFTAESDKASMRTCVLVLFALTVCVPTVNNLFGTSFANLVWVSSSVFYYIAGHYVYNYVNLRAKYVLIGGGCLAVIMAGTAIGIAFHNDYVGWLREPPSCFVAIYSLLVFLLFKRFADRSSGKAIGILSEYSFGIYILHPLFLNTIVKVFGFGKGTMIVPVVYEVFLFSIALIGSIMLTWCLKKTFMKRVL